MSMSGELAKALSPGTPRNLSDLAEPSELNFDMCKILHLSLAPMFTVAIQPE